MDDALDDGSRPTGWRRLQKITAWFAIPLAIVVCLGGLIGGMYWMPDDLFGDYSGQQPYEELPVGTCLGELPADRLNGMVSVLECDSDQVRYRVAGFESGGVRGLDAMDDICADVTHDVVFRHRTREGSELAYCLVTLNS